MGANISPTSNGRRKALDASINLVPFIDLLSCCISFLVFTAVTTSMGVVDVHGHGEGAGGATVEQVQHVVAITLTLEQKSFTLQADTTALATEAALDTLPDALARAHTAHPDLDTLHVHALDDVLYDALIHAMDLARGAHFPNIEME